MAEELTLKWGSLKGWNLDKAGPAFAALGRYFDAGEVSASAMAQRDNDAQKDALCDVIDALDAETVHLDWDGKDVSKEEAKQYVRSYQR